ncbi:hypothetical protein HY572_01105 [Candidatus Micrarchaeota archaeon]|nr:hypothetical protein [Candidatus Micrarchaeota archaeon]
MLLLERMSPSLAMRKRRLLGEIVRLEKKAREIWHDSGPGALTRLMETLYPDLQRYGSLEESNQAALERLEKALCEGFTQQPRSDLSPDHPIALANRFRKERIYMGGMPHNDFGRLGSLDPNDFHVVVVPKMRCVPGQVLRDLPRGEGKRIEELPSDSWIPMVLDTLLKNRRFHQQEWELWKPKK